MFCDPDPVIRNFIIWCYSVALLAIGVAFENYMHAQREGPAMRAAVLTEVLDVPPEERSDRLLDLCFFTIGGGYGLKLRGNKEVLEHLERRINGAPSVSERNRGIVALTDKEFSKFDKQLGSSLPSKLPGSKLKECDVPTKSWPRGFEKELRTVQWYIDWWKWDKEIIEADLERGGS